MFNKYKYDIESEIDNLRQEIIELKLKTRKEPQPTIVFSCDNCNRHMNKNSLYKVVIEEESTFIRLTKYWCDKCITNNMKVVFKVEKCTE